MTKIIFSDLDGTLINKQQQELHEGNFEAIKRWRKAGNLFVLCTGRNPIDILPTLKACDIEFDYLVLCNGASLYDQNLQCVYEKEFPLELGKEILRRCGQDHEIVTFYCDEKELVMQFLEDIVIIDQEGNKLGNYKNQSFNDYVNDATCFKMLCLFQPNGFEKLIQYQDELLVSHQEEISWFFNKDCIDIMAHGVSKGNGMMDLVNILKIDEKNVYAIGDSFNDVSMIEMASNGCTFPDCPEILRQKAKYIVSSMVELIDGIMDEKF